MKRNGCATSHTQLESNELGIVKIIETQTVIGKHTHTHTQDIFSLKHSNTDPLNILTILWYFKKIIVTSN